MKADNRAWNWLDAFQGIRHFPHPSRVRGHLLIVSLTALGHLLRRGAGCKYLLHRQQRRPGLVNFGPIFLNNVPDLGVIMPTFKEFYEARTATDLNAQFTALCE